MALLMVEGFEGFGTTTGVAPQPTGALARLYDNVNAEANMDIETGRLAGYCLQFYGSSCKFHTKVLTTDDTLIIGFAAKFLTLANIIFLTMYDDTTQGMKLKTTGEGEIVVLLGEAVLATSAAVLVTDTWYYIEFKVKCHDSAGTYELRLNENNILSAAGVDTKAGTHDYHDNVRFYAASTLGLFFDDMYVCDSTGTANNNFLGNCRVDAILPDGDDTATFDTASGGSDHYLDVDENPADDDTSYVEDATTGHKDLYDYAAISDSLGTVKGLEIKTVCRITDGTQYDLITPIKSGVEETDDSAQTLTSTSYKTKTRISETDPNTGAAWTKTNINAAKFGVKVG